MWVGLYLHTDRTHVQHTFVAGVKTIHTEKTWKQSSRPQTHHGNVQESEFRRHSETNQSEGIVQTSHLTRKSACGGVSGGGVTTKEYLARNLYNL